MSNIPLLEQLQAIFGSYFPDVTLRMLSTPGQLPEQIEVTADMGDGKGPQPFVILSANLKPEVIAQYDGEYMVGFEFVPNSSESEISWHELDFLRLMVHALEIYAVNFGARIGAMLMMEYAKKAVPQQPERKICTCGTIIPSGCICGARGDLNGQ